MYLIRRVFVMYELVHDKTYKIACAPSEDSGQPGHSRSLISLRCAFSGKIRTQAFCLRTVKTLIRLGV